jgi:hypothetical protein
MPLSYSESVYGLTGTFWIGQKTVRTGELNETKNIAFTFYNESDVQILEWETEVSGYHPRYEYEIFDNGKTLCIYRNETEYIDPMAFIFGVA